MNLQTNQAIAVVSSFDGNYEFLSNFFPCPVFFEGTTYTSLEHAYQAAKTTDKMKRLSIASCGSPGIAKRRGRDLPLRADWEDVKEDIMHKLVMQKFVQNYSLAQLLLATGEALLVEGNDWHDNFWGNCGCPRCDSIPGHNVLGFILMEVRSEIKGV